MHERLAKMEMNAIQMEGVWLILRFPYDSSPGAFAFHSPHLNTQNATSTQFTALKANHCACDDAASQEI